MPKRIYRIIEYAKVLCEGYKDMPCGCEGCPMYWENEETGEFECDLDDAIRETLKNTDEDE